MKQISFYLLLLFLLFTAACDKASCIQGTVTDLKTGQPISDAQVKLHYQYSETGSLKNQEATVSTDASGQFSYSADRKHSERIGVWEVAKAGYSGAFDAEREEGDCDDIQIKLVPYDGLFKLKIVNETGTYNSVYIQVSGNCKASYGYEGYHSVAPQPLELLPGASHTQTFNGCVGDSATIRWKFIKLGPWMAVGSVLIASTDTTFFQIAY